MISAATRKRYARWLAFNRPTVAARRSSLSEAKPPRGSVVRPALGYGALPHGQRLEGYPTDQATYSETASGGTESEAMGLHGCHSRAGSLRAIDAASRPGQPAPAPPFLSLNAETAL